jgi:hypothetical protein
MIKKYFEISDAGKKDLKLGPPGLALPSYIN